MALTIMVRLREGRYEAARGRREDPEWPPSPARVFCALVASAVTDEDWAALEWLETQAAPSVHAAPEYHRLERWGFVVTNEIREGGGNQNHLGRTNNVRQRVGLVPGSEEFAFTWPQADPDDGVLARLSRMAHKVPYVGRSTSSAEVTVLPGEAPEREEWVEWAPQELLDSAESVALPVPYEGYVRALQECHRVGHRAWEVAWASTYRRTDVPPTPPASEAAGVFADMVVFGFSGRRNRIGGDAAVWIAEGLRKAVMSRIPDPIPAQVSGHGADHLQHVAYLGLPFVGHPDADGHLLGCAVAIPEGMDAVERRALIGALLDMRTIPWRGGHVEVEYVNDSTLWGLKPERWTGGTKGARSWVSTTPVMLDRYPKGSVSEADVIAASLVRAGYPAPESVEMLSSSPVPGGITQVAKAVAGRQARPMRHCRVTFTDPVCGPVLAGAMRYRGIGLFVPDPNDQGGSK